MALYRFVWYTSLFSTFFGLTKIDIINGKDSHFPFLLSTKTGFF